MPVQIWSVTRYQSFENPLNISDILIKIINELGKAKSKNTYSPDTKFFNLKDIFIEFAAPNKIKKIVF